MDDSILNKLRKTKDMPGTQNSTSLFLLFVLFIAGYFVFFFNPSGVLQVLRTPLVILYILLVVYVGFFIFKRIKENNPTASFELLTHTFTFGKMLLLVFIIFGSFYFFYKLMISILLKALNVSLLLTIVILIIVLSIINSYTKIADDEIPNEAVDFIKDVIFYIPCLLSDVIEYAKKDYKNTPSTVIILFIILVLVCLLYLGSSYITYNNPLLLINKPSYLNKQLVSLDSVQLEELIIKSRPWYEQELLRLQRVKKNMFDISFTEGFTSVISKETIPVHMTISEYDKYILTQAMHGDDSIASKLLDVSGNINDFIKFIVNQQEKIMGWYEKLLLNLTFYNSSKLSQTILGNINGNKYHYSFSFWIYLFSDHGSFGKDKILVYGSRPSMYYDNATKELSVEINRNGTTQVLYSSSNLLYQRWNHIVMNYNYGTFDLFINNNLVSTTGDIVTYVSPDELLQVGFKSNNNLGGIAQLLYSEQPFQLNEIGTLYLRQPKF